MHIKLLQKICIIVLTCFTLCNASVDLIIFSKDRPLQLQALLESIALHVKGLQSVAVLYTTSTPQFATGYQHLAQKFSYIRWFLQNPAKHRSDFAHLLRTIFNHMKSRYIMFAVDDMIVTDSVDLLSCTSVMEKYNAYGCYLRLGKDTNFCYAYNCPMRIPQLSPVEEPFYTWDLQSGDKCWGYQHTVDMTIYRRAMVEETIQICGYHSPNVFEGIWSSKPAPPHAKGICYETSRVINIPLNLVQHDYTNNRCAHRYKVEDLLNVFMQGWRINVESLTRLPHNSPHVDIDLPLRQADELTKR